MDIKTLEEKIKKKANNEAQTAISNFRSIVIRGLRELFCTQNDHDMRFTDDQSRKVMSILANGSTEDWPAEIWTLRENKIREDIMSTMDSLQKVLFTQDIPNAKEQEEKKEEKP